jgi:hypothetical protein
MGVPFYYCYYISSNKNDSYVSLAILLSTIYLITDIPVKTMPPKVVKIVD